MDSAYSRFIQSTEIAEGSDQCWIWRASGVNGYGRIFVNGKYVMAHRFIYECFHGFIPEGHEIDHLCGIASCVNPHHLEAVTMDENKRRTRTTHCSRGHEYSEQNTSWDGFSRRCKQCIAISKLTRGNKVGRYQDQRRNNPIVPLI